MLAVCGAVFRSVLWRAVSVASSVYRFSRWSFEIARWMMRVAVLNVGVAAAAERVDVAVLVDVIDVDLAAVGIADAMLDRGAAAGRQFDMRDVDRARAKQVNRRVAASIRRPASGTDDGHPRVLDRDVCAR